MLSEQYRRAIEFIKCIAFALIIYPFIRDLDIETMAGVHIEHSRWAGCAPER